MTPYHETYETLSTETTSWVPISTMAYLRYVPIISRWGAGALTTELGMQVFQTMNVQNTIT